MEIYLWTILSVGSVYIYIWFSAFSMVYFIRWRMNINKINNFISIYSSKKESSLVSLVCWNILSVGFMYIYRFTAPSMNYWLLYPTKNELLTFQLVNLGDLVELHILSMKPHKNCFIKKWISLEYSICWFHVYIYRFSASSMDYWLLYPTKNNFLTFELVNLGDLVELHILSMKQHKNCFIKKWISLVSLVCWNILSVGLMYIYMCVFWTYGIMLCFMHVIVDHSMHGERSSSNFANFNGINRNIQLRFCIEHQTKVTYI